MRRTKATRGTKSHAGAQHDPSHCDGALHGAGTLDVRARARSVAARWMRSMCGSTICSCIGESPCRCGPTRRASYAYFRATGYPTCSPASTARREETTPRPSEHALTCDPSERPCCNTPSGQHRTPLPDIKAHVHAGPRSAVGEEDLGLMAPHGVVSAVRTVLAGATLEGMRLIAPRAALAYDWQPNQFRN